MAPSSTPGPTVGDMAGIGLYFAGAVLLPLLAGVGLDSWLHTGPVFVLVGLFVGLVSGGVAIWLKVREFTR
jgi:F0F1-type ATP synthase assembly protein I